MSGHSKWHNIQRRKGKQDSIRGQMFTKLSRDVYQAAKEGGGNPETNFRLKVAIERAKQSNLPIENITRTIAKATGTLQGVTYEEIVYEGYGPAGVAIMLEIVTDNRNRTAAAVRHIFSKRGGSLGETGCVAWMFQRTGHISIPKNGVTVTSDELMMLVLEAGATDFLEEDDEFTVVTDVESFHQVRSELEEHQIQFSDAELTYDPVTTVLLSGEQADDVLDLLEALEAQDDVQQVYSNVELSEEEAPSL